MGCTEIVVKENEGPIHANAVLGVGLSARPPTAWASVTALRVTLMLDPLVESVESTPNDFLNQYLRIPQQRGSDAVVLEVEADNLLEARDRASAFLLYLSDHIVGKLIVCERFHFPAYNYVKAGDGFMTCIPANYQEPGFAAAAPAI